MSIAAGSSSLSQSPGEVSIIPTSLYSFGKQDNSDSSSLLLKRNVITEMRDLIPGQWTVVLARKMNRAEAQRGRTTSELAFDVAFVRPRVRIDVARRKDPISRDDLDIMGPAEFLRETVPGIENVEEGLRPALEALHTQAIEVQGRAPHQRIDFINFPYLDFEEPEPEGSPPEAMIHQLGDEEVYNLLAPLMNDTLLFRRRPKRSRPS